MIGLFAFMLVPPLLVVAVVVAVDPYYLVGSPSWRGLNVIRPFYELHVIDVKPYQVRRIKPDAVSLGSSVAEVGLDPRHPGWGDRRVFNFGLPSATSYEVMLAYTHAQAVGGPLKQAVLGLDFFGFNIFFARDEHQKEARFAGNGAEAFADFLAAELATRRPAGAKSSAPTEAPGLPAPPAASESDDQPWHEALYLAVHPDVAAAIARGDFTSGREHYRLAGRAEGREGGTIPTNWIESLYLTVHPDVAAAVKRGAFLSGYHHYLAAGRAEGRQGGFPPANWDEARYLRLHADVQGEVKRGTFLSGYHHYLAAGRAEGRDLGVPPGNWDEAVYLKIHPDVQGEVNRGTFMNGYHHYVAAGRAEGRQSGAVPLDWDEATYLQVNRDVEYQISQHLFLSGYHHYLVAGRAEQRLGGYRPAGWNEAQYLAANPAARVRLALGDYRSGYAHYAAVGQSQGFQGGFAPVGPLDRLRARWPRFNQWLFRVDEQFRLIFSATALSDSLATMSRQSEAPSFDDRGMRVWDNQVGLNRQAGGSGALFRNLLTDWRWYQWLRPPRFKYCFTNTDTGMTTFEPYRFLLRRAYADGMDLRLYVTPVNTVVRQMLDALGLSARYDFWLQELVRINEQEAARAGNEPLPLWDFSDPNDVTRESIPLSTDPTPMQFFWEFSHFRRATGDLILDRVLGYTDANRHLPDNFGTRLTGANINAHLVRTRNRLADWAAANSELVAQSVAAVRNPKAQNRQSEAACW
jgi:hypothetical protein